MTITTAKLTRAAGICAAAAGAIFVGVQIKHPAFTVQAFTDGISWHARSIAKLVMSGLAIAGLTGMYLYQRRRMGKLGLVGYLVFTAGYLLMSSVESIAAFVLPGEAHSRPGYVNDVLRASAGLKTAGDIGSMQLLLALMGVTYMAGGLLFGIALFRARVLSRWAAGLLVLGAVGIAALKFLPVSFDRPMAVPTGIALIGLGVSLWRTQRRPAVTANAPTTLSADFAAAR
ncbi:MAG TPA: hypothetical protein VJ851_13505 [Jatrophihabitans sp.]|nr:hypothetical protein [Jatrophihabitans sp.]